jgi:single-strand DNA-binding protein
MANLNKVMLIGNLTRDPEIKYTPKGTAIAAFGIAVNRNYTTDTGEKREEVTFVDLEAYARVAEIIGEYCKKGRPIFVEGRLKLDTWDDKQSGQKRSKMKVVVETMQLLGGREGGPGGGGGGSSEYADADAAASPPPYRPQQQAPVRRAPAPPPRPPVDPDLDAAPDDIPF